MYDLLINKCLRFFIQVFNAFENLWNWSFTIDFLDVNITITFPQILTTSLIFLMGLFLIKKFVPLA